MEEEFCLRWKHYHSNLQHMFLDSLESESFCDVTLACEGKTLRAHKIMLSASSTYFESIFSKYNENDTIIILKDVKFDDITTIVKFIYSGKINVNTVQLESLLQTAEELRIKGLDGVSWKLTDKHNNITEDNLNKERLIRQMQDMPSASEPQVMTQSTVKLHHSSLDPAVGFRKRKIKVEYPGDFGTLKSPPIYQRHKQAKNFQIKSVDSINKKPSEICSETEDSETFKQTLQSEVLNQVPPDTQCSSTDSTFEINDDIRSKYPRLNLSELISIPDQLSDMDQNSKKVNNVKEEIFSESDDLTPEKSNTSCVSTSSEKDNIVRRKSKQSQRKTIHRRPDKFLDILKMDEFIEQGGVRPHYWDLSTTKHILKAIREKEIDMKEAAELLGVPYGTLYARYREVYGCLKTPLEFTDSVVQPSQKHERNFLPEE